MTGCHRRPPIACHPTRWSRSAGAGISFLATYFLPVRIALALRLGLPAVALAAVTACASADGPSSTTVVDAAVASYEAPAGAPAFCARLASLEELGRLPVSIGTLAAGTDVESYLQVSDAVREMRDARSDVRPGGGHDGLVSALDDVVEALEQVADGPLTDPVRVAVTAGLEQLDAQAQRACGFPT